MKIMTWAIINKVTMLCKPWTPSAPWPPVLCGGAGCSRCTARPGPVRSWTRSASPSPARWWRRWPAARRRSGGARRRCPGSSPPDTAPSTAEGDGWATLQGVRWWEGKRMWLGIEQVMCHVQVMYRWLGSRGIAIIKPYCLIVKQSPDDLNKHIVWFRFTYFADLLSVFIINFMPFSISKRNRCVALLF